MKVNEGDLIGIEINGCGKTDVSVIAIDGAHAWVRLPDTAAGFIIDLDSTGILPSSVDEKIEQLTSMIVSYDSKIPLVIAECLIADGVELP